MGRVSPQCTVIRPVRWLTYDRAYDEPTTKYHQMSLSIRMTSRTYWMREGNFHGMVGLSSEQLPASK
jgi:hypothetical protein